MKEQEIRAMINHCHEVSSKCNDKCGKEHSQLADCLEELLRKKAMLDEFWKHIHDYYEIETREELEKQAENWQPKNPLLVALHYMWKRDPKVESLELRNKELEEALEGKEEILQMYRKQFPKVFNKVMDLYQKQSLKEGKAGMKSLKYWYISGQFMEEDYSENFQRIIQAETVRDAQDAVRPPDNNMNVAFDECYETSEDARI